MKKDFCNLQTVQFLEHPIVDFTLKEPGNYDISAAGSDFSPSFTIKGQFCMGAYNENLINKMVDLPTSEIQNFIDYQCSLMQDPDKWLEQFFSLVSDNYGLLENKIRKASLYEIFIKIHCLRQEFKKRSVSVTRSEVDLDEVKFDLRKVKLDLTEIDSNEEKKAYLINLQADIEKNNISMLPLMDFIKIEFKKLSRLEKLDIPKTSKTTAKEIRNNLRKARINGPLNLFADVMYRCMHEIMLQGKPYLECNHAFVADFVCDHFVDQYGREISKSTILTILSPNKVEKRPSEDKRIDLF